MAEENTKQPIWNLLEKLPQELKEAFFSTENSEYIYNVCRKYKCLDKTSKVAEYTGQTILGLLPTEGFQKSLEGLGIEKEASEKIAREINRFVFYPVKPALEQLYGVEKTSDRDAFVERAEQKQNKTAGEDRYREVVE